LCIKKQCSAPLPKEFAFIKSVGRAFAIVKENQNFELKVKHFISPNVTWLVLIKQKIFAFFKCILLKKLF